MSHYGPASGNSEHTRRASHDQRSTEKRKRSGSGDDLLSTSDAAPRSSKRSYYGPPSHAASSGMESRSKAGNDHHLQPEGRLGRRHHERDEGRPSHGSYTSVTSDKDGQSTTMRRPSALSEDYPTGASHTMSIHNILEQQSYEHRMGISEDFDPERRGYTISNEIPTKASRSFDKDDSVSQQQRRRSRDRFASSRQQEGYNTSTKYALRETDSDTAAPSSAVARRPSIRSHDSRPSSRYHEHQDDGYARDNNRGFGRAGRGDDPRRSYDKAAYASSGSTTNPVRRSYDDIRTDSGRQSSWRNEESDLDDQERRGGDLARASLSSHNESDYRHSGDTEDRYRRGEDRRPSRRWSYTGHAAPRDRHDYAPSRRAYERDSSPRHHADHRGYHRSQRNTRSNYYDYRHGDDDRRNRSWYSSDDRRYPPVDQEHESTAPSHPYASGNGHSAGLSGREYGMRHERRRSSDRRSTSPRGRSRGDDDQSSSWDEPPPPSIKYIPPTSTNGKYEPFMLMLVGVPGSGKSTFAESLVEGKPWMYVRVNQDQLGSRRECEALTRKTLSEGKCPVVDRCNFDPSQRKHFLEIAQRELGVPVDCVVFTYPMEVCIRRCQRRRKHETIAPAQAVEVVERMVRQFSPPMPNRINAESFRNLKEISSLTTFNDLVMEYLNIL